MARTRWWSRRVGYDGDFEGPGFLEKRGTLKICIIADRRIVGSDDWRGGAGGL